jgi:hypothetical protein
MSACSCPLDRLRRCCLVFTLCCVPGVVGCSREEIQPDRSAEAKHEEHDHEHDHGIPDHKPTNFAEAVNQLLRRQKRVAGELKAGHADHAAEQIQQLLDLVRWLPELAGDTDLKQADWEAVQQIAAELETLTQLFKSSTAQTSDRDSTKFLQLVNLLKPLAAKTTVTTSNVAASDDQSVSPPSVNQPIR